MSTHWTINGRAFADAEPLAVGAAERVRLMFANQSMMVHPMRLHGHSFRVHHPVARSLQGHRDRPAHVAAGR